MDDLADDAEPGTAACAEPDTALRAEPDVAVRAEPDDVGGDPVCWLSQVCLECGRFVGEQVASCPSCGAQMPD